MKKPTKAKATPTPKAETEIYYGIEITPEGGVDIVSTRSTISEVEDDIREYIEDQGVGEFVIVKQAKGIRVTQKIELEEDNSMRISIDEFYQLTEEDEE